MKTTVLLLSVFLLSFTGFGQDSVIVLQHFEDTTDFWFGDYSYSGNCPENTAWMEKDTIDQLNSSVKIKYDHGRPDCWPSFFLQMDSVYDVSNHQILKVRYKSNTAVNLRVEVLDGTGNTCNCADNSPDINVPGDGQYHDSYFDFTNNWRGCYTEPVGAGNFVVDSTQIQRIKIFVAYDQHAAQEDSIWIDEISMQNFDPTPLDTIPDAVAVKNIDYLNIIPNPFTTQGFIEMSLFQDVKYGELALFNVLGEQVLLLHSGNLDAGKHQFLIDGKSLDHAVYFIRWTDGVTMSSQLIMHSNQ